MQFRNEKYRDEVLDDDEPHFTCTPCVRNDHRNCANVGCLERICPCDCLLKKSLGWCDPCIASRHINCINHGIAAIDGKVCPCTICDSCDADAEDDRRADYEGGE